MPQEGGNCEDVFNAYYAGRSLGAYKNEGTKILSEHLNI